MELYIETLSGTSYELRVSPFEPIISVKAKIQRLGGIPMSQQHLIWRSTELEDDFSLADYKVHNGATLRLVLAMRGGPINTRRIPIEDPAIKEMAEYMDSNKDEFGTNRQLTLLVFREGDQLNFFRVMDRGDGTLTPLSESLSGTSVYNLNDDEDDDDGVTKEKKDENDRLKVKVNELRVKMEQLSLTKKLTSSRQVTVRSPQPPPNHQVPSNRPVAQHRFPTRGDNLPKVGTLNQKPLLPPLGKTFSTSNSKLSAVDPNSGSDPERSGTPGHPWQIANMNTNSGFGASQVDSSVLAGKKLPSSESGGYGSRSGRVANIAKGPIRKALRFVTPEHTRDVCAKHRSLDPLKTSERTHTCRDTATPRWELKPPPAGSGIGRGGRQRATSTTPNTTDSTNLLLLNHSKNTSELMPSARLKFIPSSTCLSPTESSSANRLHADGSFNLDPNCNPNSTSSPHSRPSSSSSNNINHNLNPNPNSNLYSNNHLSEVISEHSLLPEKHKSSILSTPTDHLDELALFSSVGQSAFISAEELVSHPQPSVEQHFCRSAASGMGPGEQSKDFLVSSGLPVKEHLPAVSGTFRQASFERLVPSHTGIFLNHGSKGNSITKSGTNNLSRNTQVLEEPTLSCQLQRVSTTHELPSPRLSSASSQRHLPPVKSIKKSSKRCLTCSKKTGLASSYLCRCGNNFCSAHRYAETHDCTFDYKAEGRKIIRQNNPVIKASKLPKI
ncbi:AN1-type zinc finger protein 4-like [Octopus vulgaris]|uniref:AN1-type zinc finger protein 4-like n=1 Tax=Octopus vulgaris TaxID=6645 RepID=A0AA36C0R7_OCTVU|nr:AN1-type zinc finger protein 4-like [Octopus vulgaris]